MMKSHPIIEFSAKKSPGRTPPQVLSNLSSSHNEIQLENIQQSFDKQFQYSTLNKSVIHIRDENNDSQLLNMVNNTQTQSYVQIEQINTHNHQLIQNIYDSQEILQILQKQLNHLENNTILINKNIDQMTDHLDKLRRFLYKKIMNLAKITIAKKKFSK
ncbi:Hypothetical_protein [Hexamita inflata]|uniref:Hypothetical_protein n=1 Tax=Hexamita inflata TaxID=28002 RepID=A0AA86USN7_9EUKA|nr:Hypothetical protein HINF_LOCUS54074 [Hexamita inflata]